MRHAQLIAVALAFSAATAFVAAQAQPQAPPPGGGGGWGGGAQGRGGGGGGTAAPGGPARGVTINQNVVQKATATVTGEKISGTVEFNEYQVANGGLVQVVHGLHIHTVGRRDGPAFESAGRHFDPGPAGKSDPDMNRHEPDRHERSGRGRRHADRLRRQL